MMKEITGGHIFHLKLLESLVKVRLTFANVRDNSNVHTAES